jgi:prepilin-type N-terminal cleavage/methylation domain-containing protein/prepilin-type processing-associated H-X9-DG protein
MKSNRDNGFTLVELLVVIASVAVLAALLLSAIAQAKAKARTIECLNNYKQLSIVYQLYTDDNQGRLVPSTGLRENPIVNWVCAPISWSIAADITEPMLTSQSLFRPYLSGNIKVYKCPEDNFYNQAQKQLRWRARPRTASMNIFLGWYPPADVWQKDIGVTDNYRFLTTVNSFNKVAPVNIFSLIDEHPDSMDAYYPGEIFMVPSFQNGSWNSLPGPYHNRASTVLFCDGHAIVKKWLEPSTVQPVTYQWDGSLRGNNVPRRDMVWILDRMSERIDPTRFD